MCSSCLKDTQEHSPVNWASLKHRTTVVKRLSLEKRTGPCGDNRHDRRVDPDHAMIWIRHRLSFSTDLDFWSPEAPGRPDLPPGAGQARRARSSRRCLEPPPCRGRARLLPQDLGNTHICSAPRSRNQIAVFLPLRGICGETSNRAGFFLQTFSPLQQLDNLHKSWGGGGRAANKSNIFLGCSQQSL